MQITFPKLYKNEHTTVGELCVPYPEKAYYDLSGMEISQNGTALPLQSKVTATYKDGSVKYAFYRFIVTLPANRKETLTLSSHKTAANAATGLIVIKTRDGLRLRNNTIDIYLKNNSLHMFSEVSFAEKTYPASYFQGPILNIDSYKSLCPSFGTWEIVESGPVVAIVKCHITYPELNVVTECRIKLDALMSAPEISLRIINQTDDDIDIKSWWFACSEKSHTALPALSAKETAIDSTGCGDKAKSDEQNGIFHTTGTKELSDIERKIKETQTVRTTVAASNYKTRFSISDAKPLSQSVTADDIIGEANEHFTEVFYGTFFADRTDRETGICATIFQAQQNYPKAVYADAESLFVMLIPENSERIVMSTGMAREQKFLLHFHTSETPLEELDDVSLRYQMPDRPYISPDVFKEANVMPNIFTNSSHWNEDVEMAIISNADTHARCFGMLDFGDSPDPNYTSQGRGGGMLVWSNNEYDFPHACALQYARTGERRFLDYLIVTARHQMDVDVCHYHKDPLMIGGQWEHTKRHTGNGVMVCSHEWVEGLLDYYHFTGDELALETALGIGDNILRLLETPMYQVAGEANARETGWALRALTALYVETHDDKWAGKCPWIIEQFFTWKQEYGGWIAPYTDNTMIRTGFMISVAVGSLMRYCRVFPSPKLKELILSAVDDLVENATLPYGLFYYKELPSLNRLGNNPLLLEAMAIGYELTGNPYYLTCGLQTFWRQIKNPASGLGGAKQHVEDAVIWGKDSTKHFAASTLPLLTFYTALIDAGLL